MWRVLTAAIGGGGAYIALHLTAGSPDNGSLAGRLAVVIAALGATQLALTQFVRQTGAVSEQFAVMTSYVHVIELGRRSGRADVAKDPVTSLSDCIEFKDVWFRYDEGSDWALRGASFRLSANEFTGIVGENGSGKSTIVKLLCRLYEPTRGVIAWDGIDSATVSVASWRQHISVMFQDFVSYDLTVQENIGIGNLELLTAPEEIKTAARDAGILDRILRLPEGFSTALGPTVVDGDADRRSADLSGGEWQRLAAARALLRTSRDVLLLDEPSSGLDPRAESRLNRIFADAPNGGAIVVVSHRLGMVKGCDRLIVMDGGRVLETGTRDQLMAKNGHFVTLMQLQQEGA